MIDLVTVGNSGLWLPLRWARSSALCRFKCFAMHKELLNDEMQTCKPAYSRVHKHEFSGQQSKLSCLPLVEIHMAAFGQRINDIALGDSDGKPPGTYV